MDAKGEELADRIRALVGTEQSVEEKRMFGTRAFLAHGRILVGAREGGTLLVRVSAEHGAELMLRPGVSPAVMGAKTMSPSWLDVDPSVIDRDDDLMFWIDAAREDLHEHP